MCTCMCIHLVGGGKSGKTLVLACLDRFWIFHDRTVWTHEGNWATERFWSKLEAYFFARTPPCSILTDSTAQGTTCACVFAPDESEGKILRSGFTFANREGSKECGERGRDVGTVLIAKTNCFFCRKFITLAWNILKSKTDQSLLHCISSFQKIFDHHSCSDSLPSLETCAQIAPILAADWPLMAD